MGFPDREGDLLSSPACIAVTGFDSGWGPALFRRLLGGSPCPRILEIDRHPLLQDLEQVESVPIDLSETDSDRKLAEVLTQNSVEALVHGGCPAFATRAEETNPESELGRVRALLRAADQSGLRRLVISSSTLLYGARPDNPNFLTESHPLRGHPHARWLAARIEAEESVRKFSLEHPKMELTVLRIGWAIGPMSSHPVSKFFSRSSVPTCLGHDPQIQFVHEEDLLSVYERAVCESHPGTFNIVARGVLPLSTLLALAGKQKWPLPPMLLDRLSGLLPWGSSPDKPSAFYDYLRYLWVAEGERGWAEFGEPRYTSREAWISFVSSARMSQYRS